MEGYRKYAIVIKRLAKGWEKFNDQVERRADATPTQKEAMNRYVRTNAGLSVTILSPRGRIAAAMRLSAATPR